MTNAIRTNFFAYSAAPVALASCKCTIEVRIQTVLRKRRLEGSSGSFMYFDLDTCFERACCKIRAGGPTSDTVSMDNRNTEYENGNFRQATY
jgi:hypothetical protein